MYKLHVIIPIILVESIKKKLSLITLKDKVEEWLMNLALVFNSWNKLRARILNNYCFMGRIKNQKEI